MEEREGLARSMVVIPARPGPIIRLADLERGRDDLDDLLDDVFGPPDDHGPGATDVALLAGGLIAVVAALALSLPAVVVVIGLLAAGLGAVLPLRSLRRSVGARRRARRIRDLVGDGSLMRTDHPALERLLTAHAQLLAASTALAATPRTEVASIGHAALLEVATLLGDRLPHSATEESYVAERSHALRQLADAAADERTGDGEAERRSALVEARREVEAIGGGSSVTDAATLAARLVRSDDA